MNTNILNTERFNRKCQNGEKVSRNKFLSFFLTKKSSKHKADTVYCNQQQMEKIFLTFYVQFVLLTL